jgi:tetratricopeptide (TPR) repeat protein
MELDSLYMSGIEALKILDYKTAVTLLAPYQDYNSALAYVSADLNYSALEVLNSMDNSDPKVCYLMAVVLARLESNEKALMYYKKALAGDPALRHRANLDPELSNILELNN